MTGIKSSAGVLNPKSCHRSSGHSNLDAWRIIAISFSAMVPERIAATTAASMRSSLGGQSWTGSSAHAASTESSGGVLVGGNGAGSGGGLKPSLIINSRGNFEGGSPSTASISSSVTVPSIVAAKIAAATCGAGGGHGASCGGVECERIMGLKAD